ncbi:MAG: HU family DNA-binding protein [Alphaproteobacteria bacterium]
MIQAELIGAIAAKPGSSKADAGEALEAVPDSRQDALVKGETIKLPSFGKFEVAERTGCDPQTGAETTIGASKAPKFSAGKALKDAISGNVACPIGVRSVTEGLRHAASR